jgi:hypothetical protein
MDEQDFDADWKDQREPPQPKAGDEEPRIDDEDDGA